VPTFGAFYLGREIIKSDSYPDWASKELMTALRRIAKANKRF
jgi:hypothetical protein